MIATGLLVFFAVCLLIQLIYHLVFFSRLAFYKGGNDAPTTHSEGVSIVVCTHNAAENLNTLLPALYAQDCPDFEVIVVNDRSTDETFPFLVKEKEKVENLKVLTIDQTPSHIDPKKYAITLGINHNRIFSVQGTSRFAQLIYSLRNALYGNSVYLFCLGRFPLYGSGEKYGL